MFIFYFFLVGFLIFMANFTKTSSFCAKEMKNVFVGELR